MIVREVHIRRWRILFYFSFDIEDEKQIMNALEWVNAPRDLMLHIAENIRRSDPNEGFCYSNPGERKSVIGIGRAISGPEFLNTTIHELAHLVQDIAHTDGMDPFGEPFAYLAGDISHEISDIVCKMTCPRCREE